MKEGMGRDTGQPGQWHVQGWHRRVRALDGHAHAAAEWKCRCCRAFSYGGCVRAVAEGT